MVLPGSGFGTSQKNAEGWFRNAAAHTAWLSGRPAAFLLALAIVVVWLITGPIFHYSDTWQLVINTGTSIVTFLMVFLIQNTQNRETLALQLKLDELILATKNARNELVNIEAASEATLEEKKEDVIQSAES